jgi:hypothetical protein
LEESKFSLYFINFCQTTGNSNRVLQKENSVLEPWPSILKVLGYISSTTKKQKKKNKNKIMPAFHSKDLTTQFKNLRHEKSKKTAQNSITPTLCKMTDYKKV